MAQQHIDKVWDTPTTGAERIVLLVIATYSEDDDICRLPRKQIAEKASIEMVTCHKTIRSLINAGYIERAIGMRPDDAKDLLCRKKPQTLGEADETFFPSICAWCECATAHLHAHHWPVPKSEGGTETVDICPNCHVEYHALVDGSSYRLKV